MAGDIIVHSSFIETTCYSNINVGLKFSIGKLKKLKDIYLLSNIQNNHYAFFSSIPTKIHKDTKLL